MNWYIMIRFKCILQNDETYCGPACLAAIFGKYGLKVSIAKIRDIAGTDRQGTHLHQCYVALKQRYCRYGSTRY